MGWQLWRVEQSHLYTYEMEWIGGLTHIYRWYRCFQSYKNQTYREIRNKNCEWRIYIKQVRFLHRWTSIRSTGRLKPFIKPFDNGWNYILDLFFKLISLLVIWSCKCNNVLKKITSLQTSIIQVCQSALKILPQWISKPRIGESRIIVKRAKA